ncbi:MAG: SDR family oxidoreductase [Anaerolineales bacterium]|nr:SDR family oxidoreductase [Anaerolineales bacterium]
MIIIGSVLAEIPLRTSAPYNMAKAAINHLGRTLAAELAEYRINVNIINPGWIDTPGERQLASEAELEAGARLIPWGRMGTPADIGRAAVFLASDDADYITGSTLKVDGGFTLR